MMFDYGSFFLQILRSSVRSQWRNGNKSNSTVSKFWPRITCSYLGLRIPIEKIRSIFKKWGKFRFFKFHESEFLKPDENLKFCFKIDWTFALQWCHLIVTGMDGSHTGSPHWFPPPDTFQLFRPLFSCTTHFEWEIGVCSSAKHWMSAKFSFLSLSHPTVKQIGWFGCF